MLVLRTLVGLAKLFNSETSSRSIALAFAIGMALGLVPLFSLQALVLVAILLFFRVHGSAALLTFGIFKLASIPLAGLFDSIGVGLIEMPALAGLWPWLANAPVLWMLGTDHATTVGATLSAALLFVPLFLAIRAFVDLYRAR